MWEVSAAQEGRSRGRATQQNAKTHANQAHLRRNRRNRHLTPPVGARLAQGQGRAVQDDTPLKGQAVGGREGVGVGDFNGQRARCVALRLKVKPSLRRVGEERRQMVRRMRAKQCGEMRGGTTHHGSFGLPAGGVGRPVREHHAVDAELGVVGLVPEVAAVRPPFDEGAVGLGERFVEALVHPVPDEAALRSRCGAGCGVSVAYCVCVRRIFGGANGAPQARVRRSCGDPPNSPYPLRTCSDGYLLNASQ